MRKFEKFYNTKTNLTFKYVWAPDHLPPRITSFDLGLKVQ